MASKDKVIDGHITVEPTLSSLKMLFVHTSTDTSLDCLYCMCVLKNSMDVTLLLADERLSMRLHACNRGGSVPTGAWQRRGNYERRERWRLKGRPCLLPATGLRSTQISSLLPPWGPPAGVGEPWGLESEPREPLTQKPSLTVPWPNLTGTDWTGQAERESKLLLLFVSDCTWPVDLWL